MLRQKRKTCAVGERVNSSASLQYSATASTTCWSALSVKYDFIGRRQRQPQQPTSRRSRVEPAGCRGCCTGDPRTRLDSVKTFSSCDKQCLSVWCYVVFCPLRSSLYRTFHARLVLLRSTTVPLYALFSRKRVSFLSSTCWSFVNG